MASNHYSMHHIAELVDSADFDELFISELGWDNPSGTMPVRYESEDGLALTARPVASKRGVTVYHCNAIPHRDDIEHLDRAISRRSAERLLILSDGSSQQWRWPEPRKTGGVRLVTHQHVAGLANPALFQRLAAVRFRLDEEPDLTLLAVRERVRAAFNADAVTSRFYNEFKATQQDLRDTIVGITDAEDRTWYSSLLLNRLMFIYFMQRKGFLNNDLHYLRNSLNGVRTASGDDKFYEYYRDFLIPLFHEGLGSEDRKYDDEHIATLIGDVPYINGGIFALHTLEAAYDISIPDAAFERIFDFFDNYRWHLDERPTGNPEEINPEILGYIFEKYVNQKAQGAYYTHEDVTGYMTAMVIVPVVLDRLVALTGRSLESLTQVDPGRYIPEGLAFGTDQPLPQPVQSAPANQYGTLDELADNEVALPGERWREVIDRRQHHEGMVKRLSSRSSPPLAVDDAVSLNLDVLNLATDFVNDLDDPAHVAGAYRILSELRVVDPTCGSGAFLFAALDVLEVLYDAVLAKADKLVANDSDTSDSTLATLCEEGDRHLSREYFVLKTIVLSNLYGVDLMPEAAEIARLRLFLTLVATLGSREELEPLPDLDMNIRPGNLLVGCTTPDDVRHRFGAHLLAMESLTEVEGQADQNADTYRRFVQAQRTGERANVIDQLKDDLKASTSKLRDELDRMYAPEGATDAAFEQWRSIHHPFHWFVEFPEAMHDGGFDAVIGNPPYVAKSKVGYSYSGFETDKAKDIFAPCMERASSLVKSDGRFSMIVPIGFQFSDRDSPDARRVVARHLPVRWVSTYSRNPAALFHAGLGVRSTIVIGSAAGTPRLTTTDLRRWRDTGRAYLFDTNRYTEIHVPDAGPWPRTGHPDLVDLYEELIEARRSVAEVEGKGTHRLGFKQTALYYLSVFIDEPPAWAPEGKRVPQTQVGQLKFSTQAARDVAFMLLAGRLGVWWWGATGDDFHVTSGLLTTFPVSPQQLEDIETDLVSLASQLRAEQPNHPTVTKYAGKEMGNYDMSRCRHITDQADQQVLQHLGLERLWPAVLLADARLTKATGERPGTEREWPFDW